MTIIFQYQDANGDWRTGVGVPGQLSTSNVTSNSADLTLPTAVTGAQYYELTESTNNGASWTVVDSAIAPGSIVSPAAYSRSGLTSGVTYQWRLRAKFASLISPVYSAVRSAVTGNGTLTPQPGFTVSGSMLQGNSVTITKTGGGFGTKPNGQKPVACMLWEDGFSGVSPTTTLSRAALSPTDNLASIQSSIVPTGAVNAMQYNYSGATSGAILGYTMPVASVKKLFFSRTRTNFDGADAYLGGSTWNQKWWRIWSHFGSGATDIILPAYGQVNAASGSPRLTTENTDTGYANRYAGPGLDTFKNNWILEQVRLKESDLTVANGEIHYSYAGSIVSQTDRITRTTSLPDYYKYFYFPQEQNAWAQTSFRFWSSLFYLDDSWCHAVLTDSPTYNEASTNKEVQPIQAWSDTAVTIYARPRFNHLHVIDNAGTSYYIGSVA